MGIKVLFVDIDGVLLSTRSCIAQGGPPTKENPTDPRLLDPVALGLLRKLCFETGAQVVVSSSWRERHTREELEAMLEMPVLGVTPVLDGEGRSEEVNAWLRAHGNVERYAIVDDEPQFDAVHQKRLVLTDFEDGLLWQHYRQLMALL